MSDTTRIYIASDFHAAEKAWRKFLNAIKLNVYKADVALRRRRLHRQGDRAHRRDATARYEAELFGVHRRAGSAEELATLERDIADVGYYSVGDERRRDGAARRPIRPPATSCCTG